MLLLVPVIHLHSFIFLPIWLGVGFVDRNRGKNIGQRYKFMQSFFDNRSKKKSLQLYEIHVRSDEYFFSLCCFLKSRALENVMCIML